MPIFQLSLPPQISWRAARPTALLTGAHQAPARPVAAARKHFAAWIERIRQRRALAALDDGMLRDIGITRLEAARECEKPFWR